MIFPLASFPGSICLSASWKAAPAFTADVMWAGRSGGQTGFDGRKFFDCLVVAALSLVGVAPALAPKGRLVRAVTASFNRSKAVPWGGKAVSVNSGLKRMSLNLGRSSMQEIPVLSMSEGSEVPV